MTSKSHAAHRRQRLSGKRAAGSNLGGRSMEQARQLICTEAARIMAEEGVQDYHSAKRKAANRLNQPETKNLPSNQEIEDALTRHLQLFHAQDLPQAVHRLRTLARDAMDMLQEHEPKLVGAALSGNVTPYSEIHLHVSADTAEELAFLLQDRQIPYEEASRHMRFGGERHENLPAYRFTADGTNIEVVVFTRQGAREAPLSPVDGKPMRRAGRRELESLLTPARTD